MHRIVVLLPDPLGPRNPVTLPGTTSKLRSSTATILAEPLGQTSHFDHEAVSDHDEPPETTNPLRWGMMEG